MNLPANGGPAAPDSSLLPGFAAPADPAAAAPAEGAAALPQFGQLLDLAAAQTEDAAADEVPASDDSTAADSADASSALAAMQAPLTGLPLPVASPPAPVAQPQSAPGAATADGADAIDNVAGVTADAATQARSNAVTASAVPGAAPARPGVAAQDAATTQQAVVQTGNTEQQRQPDAQRAALAASQAAAGTPASTPASTPAVRTAADSTARSTPASSAAPASAANAGGSAAAAPAVAAAPAAGKQPGSESSSQDQQQQQAPAFRNVMAAVREATPAADSSVRLTGSAEQWQQPLRAALGDRLQLQLQRNSEQAVIRLEPPNMGTIEISIRHSAGALQVNLSASNSEVLRQLNNIGDNVRQDLSQRQLGDVAVTVSSSAGRGLADGGSGRQPEREQQERTPGRALSDGADADSPFAMLTERE
jgi:flagellar hook-length control protein FliK